MDRARGYHVRRSSRVKVPFERRKTERVLLPGRAVVHHVRSAEPRHHQLRQHPRRVAGDLPVHQPGGMGGHHVLDPRRGERMELVVLRGDDHHRLVLRHQPRTRGAVRQLHHRAQDGQGAALGRHRRGEGGEQQAPKVYGERGRVPGGAGGGFAAASERRVAGTEERAAVTVHVPARILRRGDSAQRRRGKTARRRNRRGGGDGNFRRRGRLRYNARDDDERRARGRRGGATTERLRQRFPPGEVRQRDGDAASDADG
mmetsp:Transcript_2808/g.10413  ORF Transcript_2808/g.10413 Transcript_2808/m.10413 type:complete len:258 (-) Transcript_2808:941-1714(-)